MPRKPPARVLLSLILVLAMSGASVPTSPSRLPGPAHDDLRSATPGEGDTLTAVPDTLRLLFTRAQNLELARVELQGPAGAVALDDLRPHPDSAALVLVPARGPWRPGAHTVRWHIVGQDGHPVSGEYTFVVAEGAEGLPVPSTGSVAGDTLEPDPGPRSAGGGAEADSPGRGNFDVGDPLFVLVRWFSFASLLGVLGAASYALLVLPMARKREPALDVDGHRASAAAVGSGAALLLVLATAARLWAQVRALGGAGGADPNLLTTFLGSTVWGTGWLLQMAASVVALAGFLLVRRGTGGLAWAVPGGAAALLAFTPALSGHAVAVEQFQVVAVLADGVHVLAAGGWIGGLLLVMAVAVPAAAGTDGAGRRTLAPVVEAFSLSALAFAALLVVSGLVAGWLHLGSLAALRESSYGRTLSLKLLLLLPLFATGAWNWLRARPALARGEDAVPGFRRSGRIELAVAVMILVVTAVLVATPPPSERSPPPPTPAGSAPAGSAVTVRPRAAPPSAWQRAPAPARSQSRSSVGCCSSGIQPFAG